LACRGLQIELIDKVWLANFENANTTILEDKKPNTEHLQMIGFQDVAILFAFAIGLGPSVSAQSTYSISIEQTGVDGFVYTTGNFLGKTPFSDEIFLTAGEGIYIVAEGYQAVSIPFKDLKIKKTFIVSMTPVDTVESVRSTQSFDTGDMEIDLVGASPFWSTNERMSGNDNIRTRFLSFLDMEVPFRSLRGRQIGRTQTHKVNLLHNSYCAHIRATHKGEAKCTKS